MRTLQYLQEIISQLSLRNHEHAYSLQQFSAHSLQQILYKTVENTLDHRHHPSGIIVNKNALFPQEKVSWNVLDVKKFFYS